MKSNSKLEDWKQPHLERVIPHLAVKALVELDASDVCLQALDGPYRTGALWALKSLHKPTVVKQLAFRLSTTHDRKKRADLLTTLIRLYHFEGRYTGGWWGTRPDTRGPYYDRKTWLYSATIAATLSTVWKEADADTRTHVQQQLARHLVKIPGISKQTAVKPVVEKPIAIPPLEPNNPKQIGNLKYELVLAQIDQKQSTRAGRPALLASAERGKVLFKRQTCVACHTYANGQTPKGPHLVDIGKRSKMLELVESIVKPSAKIAQGFDTYSFLMEDGRQFVGFVTSESADRVGIRQTNGVSKDLLRAEIDERVKQKQSMMPQGVAASMTVDELLDLVTYLQSLGG